MSNRPYCASPTYCRQNKRNLIAFQMDYPPSLVLNHRVMLEIHKYVHMNFSTMEYKSQTQNQMSLKVYL